MGKDKYIAVSGSESSYDPHRGSEDVVSDIAGHMLTAKKRNHLKQTF
jgi:hypothetical protein